MPNVTVECCNCGNEKSFGSLFEADDFVDRCDVCTNDLCPHCGDKKHPDFHPQCYLDVKECDE